MLFFCCVHFYFICALKHEPNYSCLFSSIHFGWNFSVVFYSWQRKMRIESFEIGDFSDTSHTHRYVSTLNCVQRSTAVAELEFCWIWDFGSMQEYSKLVWRPEYLFWSILEILIFPSHLRWVISKSAAESTLLICCQIDKTAFLFLILGMIVCTSKIDVASKILQIKWMIH